MLELTVKTLDSQNHSFTLPDEATVLNLKESILEKMEVPIATQRLIFHGKVLHDPKKLTEYGDVNGKVIHLVQRAPPSSRATDNSGTRAESGGNGGRSGRRMQPGNATYLGSMSFPAELMDQQGGFEVTTRPSQAMARNRIDCAKRMMGYARQSLRQIEEPQQQPPQPTTSRRRWSSWPPRSRDAEGRRDPAATTTERGTSTATASPTTSAAATATSNSPSSQPAGERMSRPTPPLMPFQGMMASPASFMLQSSEMNSMDDLEDPRNIFIEADEMGHPDTIAAAQSAIAAAMSVTMPSLTVMPSNADGTTFTFSDDSQNVAVEVEIESSENSSDNRTDAEASVTDNSSDLPPTSAASATTATAAAGATAPTAAPPPNRREEVTRLENMVPLLQDLENLHTQLNPYLVRCREVLAADPAYEESTAAARQESSRVFMGMSETLHSLAHACHALSDLMVDFEEEPPRSLRCRPVVLQHSTILETGIPIRFNPQDFEAQINVRRVDVSTGTESTAATNTPTTSTASAATGTSTSTTAASTPPPPPPPPPPRRGGLLIGIGSRTAVVDNAPDNMPENMHIVMDLSRGPGMPSISGFSWSPLADSGGPPPEGAPDSNSTSTENSANTSSATVPDSTTANDGPEEIHFRMPPDLRSWTGGPLGLVQAIAGEIQNELFNRTRMPEGSAASAENPPPPTTESQPQSASTATPPGTQFQPVGPNLLGRMPQFVRISNVRGANSTTRNNAEPPMNAIPDPRGIHLPVGDMFQTLFQATFDPTLPCNSHHIRTTRQRASQTPRPSPPIQILTRQVGAPMLRRSRRLNIVVPPQENAAAASPNQPNVQPTNQDALPRRLTSLLQGILPMSSSIADFLNIVTDAPHVDGQSIVIDLLMTLARNVSFLDVLELTVAAAGPVEDVLNRLRPVLQEFVMRRLLEGETASTDAISRACDRLYTEMRPFIDAMEVVRLRESVDLPATINNLNQSRFPDMISLIVDTQPGNNFGSQITRSFTNYLRHLTAIILHCCVDGNPGLDTIIRNCVRLVTRGIPEDIQQWTEFHSIHNVHRYTSRLNVPLEEFQRFLVYRIPSTPAASAPQEPMETDASPEWVPTETIPSPEKVEEPIAEALVAMDTENLPDVVIGSESWHAALPSEWVPVIARDTQRQRKQASQKPFSDSYLAGMPPKRRKIIQSNKPVPDAVAHNISEGLRQAIQSAGVTSPNAERAIADAGRDPTLQQAYKQQEKASGSKILESDPDYKPSRFPSAHKYFEK